MTKIQAQRAKDWLQKRIESSMEWYLGCDAVQETKDYIYKDINSIVKEFCDKYGFKDLPFTFRVAFTEDGIIEVRAIDKKLS